VISVAGLVIVSDVTIVGVYLGSHAPATPVGIVAVAAAATRVGVSLIVVVRATGSQRGSG
jgi:hypothetical protein